jgi:hypothetical protein
MDQSEDDLEAVFRSLISDVPFCGGFSMSSSLRYFGGKARLMPRLLPLIANHEIYVSAFGGGAGDLRHKPRSRHEVYNDVNENMVKFFRVLSPRRAPPTRSISTR